ncbi:hypothetical protein N657DRAFT_484579 [Parathielavia appendiculata]|uniref:Uncharacterized protein n=1 Tax=Parathielavia appendiculata TaxID=2587402 RepID=A0AAN6U040_9PEZI|nr:hypothetical protein N657DRAFT_484579 [Parathielavia appendiculata]
MTCRSVRGPISTSVCFGGLLTGCSTCAHASDEYVERSARLSCRNTHTCHDMSFSQPTLTTDAWERRASGCNVRSYPSAVEPARSVIESCSQL